MSNYLAIATVTAGLYQLLLGPVQTAVGSSATIVFGRPHAKDDDKDSNPHLNIYLYQVTPNAAFRNTDLPTRRADGTLVKRPMAALDLHYLFSFHGKEELFEPQLMLGIVASTLQAEPVLLPSVIQSALSISSFSVLAASDLANQSEKVRFTPTALSLEEFSKLWSAFFQVEYRLSMAYQATVVLIENEIATPQDALPVQARNVYAIPFQQPTITQVTAKTGAGQPILPTSTLVIQGSQLLAGNTVVRIGNLTVTPPTVTATAIILPVPTGLQAGVLGVQVIQQMLIGTPAALHSGIESNVAPMVLQPVISPTSASTSQVQVTIKPAVQPGQKIKLLLNQVTGSTPAAFTFTLPPLTTASSSLTIPISGVAGGGTVYFIRVSIDGAESPLNLDPSSSTFGPTVTIA
jgi:hypothetical protein